MKIFKTNHSQAQVWLQTLQTKTGKRHGLEATVVPQEQSFNENPEYAQYPQTVFTRADLGHNSEEASKIQQLYKDLQNLPVSPVLVLG